VELRQLRYAVAVADYLNFRQASRALHVAQPSLSVQIKQLEEELDHDDLARSGQSELSPQYKQRQGIGNQRSSPDGTTMLAVYAISHSERVRKQC
jgi:Bacterial regulatory helix-turn-helix protein, lysR family